MKCTHSKSNVFFLSSPPSWKNFAEATRARTFNDRRPKGGRNSSRASKRHNETTSIKATISIIKSNLAEHLDDAEMWRKSNSLITMKGARGGWLESFFGSLARKKQNARRISVFQASACKPELLLYCYSPLQNNTLMSARCPACT